MLREEVPYRGCVVGLKGMYPESSRVMKVKEYLTPTDDGQFASYDLLLWIYPIIAAPLNASFQKDYANKQSLNHKKKKKKKKKFYDSLDLFGEK